VYERENRREWKKYEEERAKGLKRGTTSKKKNLEKKKIQNLRAR